MINNLNIPFERKFVKNLGLLIEPTISWRQYIMQTTKKVFYSLHSLNRMKNILPTEVKRILVQSLIMPILDYADVVYKSCSESHSKRLQYAHNSCVRFIFNLKKRDHITPVLKQIGWLKLKERRALHSLLLLYKILRNKVPKYLYENFSVLRSERNGQTLTIPSHRTSLYGSTFMISACREWNLLSSSIRNRDSLKRFKNEIKKCWLEAYQ